MGAIKGKKTSKDLKDGHITKGTIKKLNSEMNLRGKEMEVSFFVSGQSSAEFRAASEKFQKSLSVWKDALFLSNEKTLPVSAHDSIWLFGDDRFGYLFESKEDSSQQAQ